jgi:diguanylate cyclase (GGDEF)-like protein/PAS domain S-box-containing protein
MDVLAGDQVWWLALAATVLLCLAIVGLVGTLAYRLRRQKVCLDTAIDNMSQGLTMFDRSGRLVLCNRRYIEMYGLSPEVVRPGCSVRQVVEHRIETGSLTVHDAQSYVEDRQATLEHGAIVSKVFELPNGSTILVTRRPMAGQGWVATHEDITERRRAEAEIARMARYDGLTGLANRALLRERLEAALRRVARGERLAVLYLDLDHFKGTNDSLGHPVGDGLLKTIAGRLRGCLRETDTIARLGGDEFAIIQTAIEHQSDATILAQRLREAVIEPHEIDGHQVLADVSIGIALAPDDGTEADQLLKHADMAMYAAKNDGRGAFRYFAPEMNARAQARRRLELDLRNAITNEEFELYYQPLINLDRNEVCSCEALLRWHHPERGMIAPEAFIPVAEETGLITAIGDWALRAACAEAMTWPDHVTVAVNVSPVQFKNQTLVLTVVAALAASGLPARRLAIEITEAVLMQDNETTLATLHQLRDLGVQIVMDDFGTGYSSLSYLRSFPFDKIKIDRSFINDVSDKGDASAIVQATTNIATHMNMSTTAEGVETPEQLSTVRALGVTEMQGYLFSRPQRAAEIARLFRTRGHAMAGAERAGAAAS